MKQQNYDIQRLRRGAHYGLAVWLLIGTVTSVLLAGAASFGIETLPLREECGLMFCSRASLGTGATSIMVTLFGVVAVPVMSWGWSNVGLLMQGHNPLAAFKSLPTEQYPHVLKHVAELAQRLGVPVPAVAIIKSPLINAFAVGRSPANAGVVLTTGLLHAMRHDEGALAAVIGHELGHIASGDMRAMEWANGWQNALVWYVGEWQRARRAMRKIVFTISELAVKKHSRDREFWADAVGAALVDPAAMIRALKITHEHFPKDAPNIAAPERQFYWRGGDLFSTHPSVVERIKAVEGGHYIRQVTATGRHKAVKWKPSWSLEHHVVPVMLAAGAFRYFVVMEPFGRKVPPSFLSPQLDGAVMWALVAGFILVVLGAPWKIKPVPGEVLVNKPEPLAVAFAPEEPRAVNSARVPTSSETYARLEPHLTQALKDLQQERQKREQRAPAARAFGPPAWPPATPPSGYGGYSGYQNVLPRSE